jgi:hypothetical protein
VLVSHQEVRFTFLTLVSGVSRPVTGWFTALSSQAASIALK